MIMKNLNERLNELSLILINGGENSNEQFDAELESIKKEYNSPEDIEAIADFMDQHLLRLTEEVRELQDILIRDQLKEIREIIPVSYIARNYFGKSPAWLNQRINGIKVRGKVYTLKDDEIDTLNFALQDISRKIGATTITR